MKPVRAHVERGRIVVDEPVTLPEGTTVEVWLADPTSPSELAELDAALDAGSEDFARGDIEDARALALRLAAKP